MTSPAKDPVRSDRDRGRFTLLALVRVGNFPFLRRLFGTAGVASLADDVRDRIEDALPGADVTAVAQDCVKVRVDSASRDEARILLDLLSRVSGDALGYEGERFALEIQAGAAVAEKALDNDVRLIETAERALEDARTDAAPVLYDLAEPRPTIDPLTLAGDIARAVERNELFLCYQPKVHVRRHEVNSVEALLRWQHPTRGLISPGDFIPMAEQTRAIGPMTLWTIRRAIQDQRTLAARGHDLRVFVNIAGVLLSDEKFIAHACNLVACSGAMIGFEVTETSVIRDPESAITNLNRVAATGITVAIDDYGAGLSSLAYLKRLPARELKIDKLFVTQLTSSHRDPLIVRSTIDLAHALEMDVVAEGVETPASLALLSVMGCDLVQGFLVSVPLPLDALTIFLDEERHRAAAEASQATAHRLAATWGAN